MVHDAGLHADGQGSTADARTFVGRAGRRRVGVHTTPSPFGGLQRGCCWRSHAKSQSVKKVVVLLLEFCVFTHCRKGSCKSFLLPRYLIGKINSFLSSDRYIFFFKRNGTNTNRQDHHRKDKVVQMIKRQANRIQTHRGSSFCLYLFSHQREKNKQINTTFTL